MDKILTLEEQYWQLLCNKILVSKEDLTPNEHTLIKESYVLFKEKLVELKTLEDEVKRISLELANLKAMKDDKDYDNEDTSSVDNGCLCEFPLEQNEPWCQGCEIRREAIKNKP